MKAIVLAGGFAKRMWPLTKDQPKHLLTLAGRPMLDFVIEKLEKIPELDTIFISTNAKFESHFRNYLKTIETEKSILLFIEDTRAEGEKLGSVGALGYLIENKKIDDELMVIGGDNIFNFQMTDLANFFKLKKSNVVALYDLKNKSMASLYGVVEVDSEDKITDFEEKPKNPKSTLISTACYMFTRSGVKNILRYLKIGNDPDKIGHFIEWLYKNDDVSGYVFEGYWFDIGSFESYDEANTFFSKNK